MAEENLSLYFLISQNKFLRRDIYNNEKKNFELNFKKSRFGTTKIAKYRIEEKATDPNPSTCMSLEINHTTNIANLLNISVHSFCNITNMDEIMSLMDSLLKKIKWKVKLP